MGYFAGYGEYRYGTTKKVTLAQVFKGDRRKHVLGKILDELRDWRSTPYEKEGAIHAGIRSALCLDGCSWPVAEAEASGLLTAAFQRMGAQRPSWTQGQHEYVEPRENCHWCRVELPDDLQRGGSRSMFCSEVCARSAIERRVETARTVSNQTYRAAHVAIRRIRAKPKKCAHCESQFRTVNGDQRFCSNDCRTASRVTILEKTCAQCGLMFRPGASTKEMENGRGKFCSVPCKTKYQRNHAPIYQRECEFCSCCFVGREQKAKYCSKTCQIASFRVVRGEWPKKMSRHLFDHLFITLPKKVSPPLTLHVFDSWFEDAA